MQTTTIRLSDEEYEALVAASKQTERSRNEILREAVRNHPEIQDYLKNKKAKQTQREA
ncbi:MAG: ribbon-helix-helix protein, CopG family (plasmid) [Leptolyngbya sp. BL-A-14]